MPQGAVTNVRLAHALAIREVVQVTLVVQGAGLDVAAKFSGEPNAYLVFSRLAEIEFYHLDKNTDAAAHYMQAARKIPDAEAKSGELATLRHDAIYNALAALERVRLQELEQRKGKQLGETETDKRFAEALELYA